MDPLSEVLALLKPRTYMSGGFDLGDAACIQFPRHEGIKCYAVVSGECWLLLDGQHDALSLKTGDCFVLPSGRPFRLASDITLPPTDFRTAPSRRSDVAPESSHGDRDCFIAGGHFILAGQHAAMLLGALPPVIHVRKEADKAVLRWCIQQMTLELRERQPGSSLVAQHLAYVMLVQALRRHLSESPAGGAGWLFALADKEMGGAITAMHAEPAHRWTLRELAQRVGLSRSTFALRFKETVGTSPMEYLTRWRMLLAGDRLANTNDAVSAIGFALGYESESAFSTAFKRVMGCSPRQYARDETANRDAAGAA